MRLLVPAGFLLTAAAIVAGCGGGGDDGGGSTVSVTNGAVTVGAVDTAFDITRIETTAGPLEVTLDQNGSQLHTFVVEDISKDDFKLEVNGSATDTGTVELEAGEYEYFCDVAGHRDLGMEGTLVVE